MINDTGDSRGLGLDNMILVHTTDDDVVVTENGVQLRTSFDRSGGFSQSVYDGELQSDFGGSTRTIPYWRGTNHFTVQKAVKDHVYGKFSGKPHFVFAPLKQAVIANGPMETFATSDVAFPRKPGQPLDLPEGVVVTRDLKGQHLSETEFMRVAENGRRIFIAPAITEKNKDQALKAVAELQKRNPNVMLDDTYVEDALNNKGDDYMCILEGIGLSYAGNGQAPRRNLSMGMDGWAIENEGEFKKNLQDLIRTSAKNKDEAEYLPAFGRHSGMPGDLLSTFLNAGQRDSVQQIADDPSAHPSVRSFAKQALDSQLFKEFVQAQYIEGVILAAQNDSKSEDTRYRKLWESHTGTPERRQKLIEAIQTPQATPDRLARLLKVSSDFNTSHQFYVHQLVTQRMNGNPISLTSPRFEDCLNDWWRQSLLKALSAGKPLDQALEGGSATLAEQIKESLSDKELTNEKRVAYEKSLYKAFQGRPDAVESYNYVPIPPPPPPLVPQKANRLPHGALRVGVVPPPLPASQTTPPSLPLAQRDEQITPGRRPFNKPKGFDR
jgi:hypothetical protein